VRRRFGRTLRSHKLQDPKNRREIVADEKLKPDFGKSQTGYVQRPSHQQTLKQVAVVLSKNNSKESLAPLTDETARPRTDRLLKHRARVPGFIDPDKESYGTRLATGRPSTKRRDNLPLVGRPQFGFVCQATTLLVKLKAFLAFVAYYHTVDSPFPRAWILSNSAIAWFSYRLIIASYRNSLSSSSFPGKKR